MVLNKRELKGYLSLSNSGHLSLFPVGSGSAFTKNLYQNNLLVIKGNAHILVDCGTRTPEAFFNLGLPITEVKNFLISHSHADHIGGLEEVILMGRYVTRRKPHIVITNEYQDLLWNQSLKGGAGLNERKGSRSLGFKDYWEVMSPVPLSGFSRDTHQIDIDGLNLVMFRTKHFPDSAESWRDSAYSTGLIIDRRVLFTGDTRFDPQMIEEFCSHFPIDLILHDVQFFPGGVHASFDELKTLQPEIKKKMLLMHYPDTFMNHEQKILDAGFRGFLEQHKYYDFID